MYPNKRNIRGIQPLPQEESFPLKVKKALEDINSLCQQNKKGGNPKGKKPKRVVAPPLGILNSEPTPPAEPKLEGKPEVEPQAEPKKEFGSDNPVPPGSINNVLDPIPFGAFFNLNLNLNCSRRSRSEIGRAHV